MENKKAIVTKDYIVTCRDWIKGKEHGPIYNKIIFKQGTEVYYKEVDNVYYVSENRECLRHMNYYNTKVEDLTKDQFKQHFQ